VVLAYYFNNIDDKSSGRALLPLLLVFVAIISAGFAYLHWRGARDLSAVPNLLEYIAEELELPGRPHIEFAVVFLVMNCAMFLFVSLGCIIVVTFAIF
jgi:hypothetical protein